MDRDRDRTHVVTCFLRHDADVLLLRRSEAVGSYAGRWGGVAGHAEGDPDAAAREEIAEETGLDPASDVTLVRAGEPFDLDDGANGYRWTVHPYLFDCVDDRPEIRPNRETAAYEWAPPPAILRRESVPALWRSYAAVAPTPGTIRADDAHGSAYLSVRALEALRDRAAVLAAGLPDGAGWRVVGDDPADRLAGRDGTGDAPAAADAASLRALAAALVDARPAMAALENRVNRAMGAADRAADVERAATEGIERALAADRAAAAAAAERIADRRVYTLSRSGTVLDALLRGDPEAVFLPESRPGAEGRAVAAALADAGVDVTLTTDAAAPGRLAAWDADLVLVGADAVLPDGRVRNKVGTVPAALAAERADVPVHVACARDKIVRAGRSLPAPESAAPEEVYDGPAAVDVENPLFELVPAEVVTGVLTEDGLLDADGIAAAADDHRALAGWRDGADGH